MCHVLAGVTAIDDVAAAQLGAREGCEANSAELSIGCSHIICE